MKEIIFLTLVLTFCRCTKKTEHPRIYNCENMKLRQHDLSKAGHHLIVDNYSEECLDNLLQGELVKKYLDTVQTITPMASVSLYYTDENFPKNREYQDFPTINKDLIVEYAFFDEKDSLLKKPTGVFIYLHGKRRYITYPTWDK